MKKLIALLLVLMLSITLLAGCGGNSEEPAETDDSVVSAEPDPEPEDQPENEPEDEPDLEPEDNGGLISSDLEGVTVSAEIPAQGWCVNDDSSDTLRIYNVPTKDDAYSNSPIIKIEMKTDAEKFDFYKDDFENLDTSIGNRVIGGIEMVGRTYEYVGMNWIQFIGVIDDGHAVGIMISGIDIENSEGSDVLDSIKFD